MIDVKEVEQAQRRTDIHVKRMKADEIELVQDEKHIFFPVQTGRLVMPEDSASSRHRRSVTVRSEPERQSEILAEREPQSQSSTPQPVEQDTVIREPVESEPIDESQDYWTLHDHSLVRHHKTPRTKLFIPTADSCPLPLRHLDVQRMTSTNIHSASENGSSTIGTLRMLQTKDNRDNLRTER